MKSRIFPVFAMLCCFSIYANQALKDSMLAGQWDLVLDMIKQGDFKPDIKMYGHESSHYGATALTYAAQHGKTGIVKAMLEESLKRNIPIDVDACSKAGSMISKRGRLFIWI